MSDAWYTVINKTCQGYAYPSILKVAGFFFLWGKSANYNYKIA